MKIIKSQVINYLNFYWLYIINLRENLLESKYDNAIKGCTDTTQDRQEGKRVKIAIETSETLPIILISYSRRVSWSKTKRQNEASLICFLNQKLSSILTLQITVSIRTHRWMLTSHSFNRSLPSSSSPIMSPFKCLRPFWSWGKYFYFLILQAFLKLKFEVWAHPFNWTKS